MFKHVVPVSFPAPVPVRKEIGPLPEGMHELKKPYLHLMVDEGARLLYSEWVRKPT